MNWKRVLLGGFLLVLLAFASIVIPVVPYSLTVRVPGDEYRDSGRIACQHLVPTGSSNQTALEAYLACLKPYRWKLMNQTGYGSISYRLAEYGTSPFPPVVVVSQPEFTAALYTAGGKVQAAEQIPSPQVLWNPSSVPIGSKVLMDSSGTNLTVIFVNKSEKNVTGAWAYASVPGETWNYTDSSGVTWMFTPRAPTAGGAAEPCLRGGSQAIISPGQSCAITLRPYLSSAQGAQIDYSVELRGYLGGEPFIVRRVIHGSTITLAGKLWMDEFVKFVNLARNGPPLQESAIIDAFAKIRYNTSIRQPDISDYGFDGDAVTFFGSNLTAYSPNELILYPGDEFPYAFSVDLQGVGPGHWASMMNSNYTKFGYFMGTSAYEIVDLPCPVTEIPGPGINITQYFQSHGCSVHVAPTLWLVLILGR